MTRMLGIVSGMASETLALGKWVDDPRVRVAVSGADPDRAEAEARRLVAEGASGLLSWGIAGGLAPALKTGAVVRPAVVAGPGDQRWEVMLGSGDGVLAGYDRLVRHPSAKAGLRAATGAMAVDMESHRVACVAAEAGIPFGTYRVVSDPAERTLPALAEQALGEDGRPRIGPILWGLLSRPGDLPDLIRAGRDSRVALDVLARDADAVIDTYLSELADA